MSKPIHPIRKMQHAMEKAWWSGDEGAATAIAVRSVKPLLDALEMEHGLGGGCRAHVRYGDVCDTCGLIAAWKEPIK